MQYETLLGVYHYCMLYHGGQWSREYRIFCKVSRIIQPCASEQRVECLLEPGYERAREVYEALGGTFKD